MFEKTEWEDPTDVPALMPGDVHVWQFSLSMGEAIRSLLLSCLSSEEHARAGGFHFARDRNRHLVAHGVLRILLARYAGVHPAALRFERDANNKPALTGQRGAVALSFNLSHAGALAVCAVSRNRNLGIDVEEIRKELPGEEIAGRYFSPQERSALMSLPLGNRSNGFFACWTAKEAYVKALGTGLHAALDSFTVSLGAEGTVRFLEGVDPKWQGIAFTAGRCFPAALVYDGDAAHLRFFRLASASVPLIAMREQPTRLWRAAADSCDVTSGLRQLKDLGT